MPLPLPPSPLVCLDVGAIESPVVWEEQRSSSRVLGSSCAEERNFDERARPRNKSTRRRDLVLNHHTIHSTPDRKENKWATLDPSGASHEPILGASDFTPKSLTIFCLKILKVICAKPNLLHLSTYV